MTSGISSASIPEPRPPVAGAVADPAAAPQKSGQQSTSEVPGRGVRRLPRGSVRRPHHVNPVFSDQEFEDITAAAALAGVTPTAYVQKCAVDVSRQRIRPAPTALVDAIGELLQARLQVQKFSVLVNQAVAKWHSTGEMPAELMPAVDLVVRVLPRLEEAAGAVRIAQGGGRRRAVLVSRRRPKSDSASADDAEDERDS